MSKSKTHKNKTVTKNAVKSLKKAKVRPMPSNQLTLIEMRNLTSELIQDVSYSNGDLFVTMRNGARYCYPEVESDLVQEFLTAESFGRFFNDHIRHLDYRRLDQ